MKSSIPATKRAVWISTNPAGAVYEVDDDGDVVGISKNDRVRHVVRNDISGEHPARCIAGAVDIIHAELVLESKQRLSVALLIGLRRVEEACLHGLFSGRNTLTRLAPRSSTFAGQWRERR